MKLRPSALGAAAVASTIAAAVAAFSFARTTAVTTPVTRLVVDSATWQSLTTEGVRVGPADATLEVVVFSDYTCAFCRQLDVTLVELREAYPDDLAIIYRFFPRSDGLARTAALAGICGASAGRFEDVNRRLFEHSATLSQVDWASFGASWPADAAATFQLCLLSAAPTAHLARDLDAAYALSISGTPLSILNREVVEGAFDARYVRQRLQEASLSREVARQ